MRSSGIFGFFLLFLLDFWRPTEGLCNFENDTTATCHLLEDIHGLNTQDLVTLKTSVAEKILNPALLQNLTVLRHLDLSRGNISEIPSGSFLQLPQLLSLNLAENHIRHLNSSSLEGLTSLRFLSLKKNNLRYLPEVLLDLKNLKTLDVARNHIDCNCDTLKTRDRLVERGVKILKRAICSGPKGVKGWSLLKPSSELVCIFEKEDEGMQGDEPADKEAKETQELGSGEEEVTDDDEGELEDDIDVPPKAPEAAETPAPETPVPHVSAVTEAETPVPKPTEPATSVSQTSAPESTAEATPPTPKTEESITLSKPVEVSLEKSKLKEDDGLFFDSEEKSSTENPPTEKTPRKIDVPFPIEGSGDDDEFEGSGTVVPPIDFGKKKEETVFDKNNLNEDSGSLFDSIFGNWGDTPSTTTPEEKVPKFSDIEKEEFMPVVPEKTSEADGMLAKSIPIDSNVDKVAVVKDNGILSKDGETKQELADASSQDSKTGNGPMVVLIVLLGIFVALLGLAAYKGDFCKKKRIPEDAEIGTELKEMRKSLLEGGNSVQPKISNGNAENVPLIKVSLQTNAKEKEIPNKNGNGTIDGPTNTVQESPVAPTESLDPVKPPRKSIPQEEARSNTNGKSHSPPCIDPEKLKATSLHLSQNEMKTPPNTPMNDFGSPPLSPDAQRVKIILQDNPDSVPKTPILITRTKMGENLVKTP